MKIKYLIAGLLMMSMALALNVNIDNPLITVSKGQVADYGITITNPDEGMNVLVTTSSDVPTSISETAFYLDQFESNTIHVFAITNGLGEGLYLIELDVNGQKYNLALNIKAGEPALFFDPIYDEITVRQGEFQDLKFLVRNEGKERLRNIVFEGNIPTSLDPEYPETLDLDPNEMREVEVRITIPEDYPADEYEFIVKAGAGNTIKMADIIVEVKEGESLEDKLDLDLLLPWNPIKEGDNIIGYRFDFRITNRGMSDLHDVEFRFIGVPEGWDISGDETFDIQGYERKDIQMDIIPADFDERDINVSLVKGNETITSQVITFAGYKVGMTGFALMGGDLVIGILVVVILSIVLLYVRQKYGKEEAVEEEETKSYLEKLVEKSKAEEAKKKTPKKKRK